MFTVTTNHFAAPDITNNPKEIKLAQENPLLCSTVKEVNKIKAYDNRVGSNPRTRESEVGGWS